MSTNVDLAAAIIDAVYRYRFLTRRQLQRLFPTTTSSVLANLTRTGHIAAIKRPTLAARTADTVYALAGRGADAVAGQLGIDRGHVRWRKYHNLVGLPYLDHRLATNDLRIALSVGAPRHGVTLAHWYYEPPIREEVDDPDDPTERLAYRPDAYLRLRFADGRVIHAFVEVDMATESNLRFAAKIRRYLAYKGSALFRARVGGRSFRVLITVPTSSRLASLKRVIEGQGGGRVFWLAKQDDVAEGTLHHGVWRIAGSEERAPLVSPVPHNDRDSAADFSP